MRALALLLAGCGVAPDYVTRQGIPVYDTGVKWDRFIIEQIIDATVLSAMEQDVKLIEAKPFEKFAGGSPELHLHRGRITCGAFDDSVDSGGCYDSVLNNIHIVIGDYRGLHGEEGNCAGHHPFAHEFSHWFQDVTGRDVGHDMPYFPHIVQLIDIRLDSLCW